MDLDKLEFRGKRIHDKKWIFGTLIHDGLVKNKTTVLPEGTYHFDEYDNVIPETVGMFSTLIDRLDQKLYSDDIIELSDSGVVMKVAQIKYEDGMFLVYWDNGFYGGDADVNTLKWAMDEYTVTKIGNIFDKPHLLNQ